MSFEVVAARYPAMESVSKGWRRAKVLFKGEGSGHVNIGLGGGTAVAIFNRNIGKWEMVRR